MPSSPDDKSEDARIGRSTIGDDTQQKVDTMFNTLYAPVNPEERVKFDAEKRRLQEENPEKYGPNSGYDWYKHPSYSPMWSQVVKNDGMGYNSNMQKTANFIGLVKAAAPSEWAPWESKYNNNDWARSMLGLNNSNRAKPNPVGAAITGAVSKAADKVRQFISSKPVTPRNMASSAVPILTPGVSGGFRR